MWRQNCPLCLLRLLCNPVGTFNYYFVSVFGITECKDCFEHTAGSYVSVAQVTDAAADFPALERKHRKHCCAVTARQLLFLSLRKER